MGTTRVAIANLALSHVGVSTTIADLSEEPQCGLHFDNAVETTLEEFPWPEATKYRELSLVQEQPNDDWLYAYRYPTDCVFVRRLVTEMGRQDPTPPPFIKGQDDVGTLIYTDREDATIEYTVRLMDPARYSATLASAIGWKLAELIAPTLSKIEGREKYCAAKYGQAIALARVKSANEQQRPPEQDAEHIQARA